LADITLRLGGLAIPLKSEPFRGDPEGAETFYAAVRRFLMLWGRFENNFDGLLGIIATLPGWTALREPIPESVPAAWKKKAKMWRGAFSKVPRLAPQRDRALDLVSRKHKGGLIRVETTLVTHPQIEAMVQEADKLNARLAPLALFLASLSRYPTTPGTP
jgi:hypothetical protein